MVSLIDVISSKETKRLLYVFIGIVIWLGIHIPQIGCFICPHGSCGCDSGKYLILKVSGVAATGVYLYFVVKLIQKEDKSSNNEHNS